MESIYREQLMEHYKDPQNRGSLTSPDVSVDETNPFCGDNITLQLKVEDNKITDIAFDGEACAVSVASASLVTDFIKGKSLDEARLLDKSKVLELLGVELTTSRVKCALLVLDALNNALNKYEEFQSEVETNSGAVPKKITKITRDTNIAQVVLEYPEVAEVLLDYGLHCVGCFANAFDSIEAGAKIHGYTDEEIDELLERIREVVEFGE